MAHKPKHPKKPKKPKKMADQITDNRTSVDVADASTNYDDLAGAGAGNVDTDVFIQGTGSIGEIISNTVNGVLFDAGSAQNWANNVFYIWINCGIVGLLDTKANGGFTIRFCGATVTDWFEFNVGGNDSWPTAIQGGWVQFVVDIEATPSTTNGTPPATSAIRYVGWSGITASVMTKMVDNTWIDQIARLPDGTPGIIIEGRDGGTTDWDSDDIVAQLGIGVGTFKDGPGGTYIVNTPIQFGISDTTTHGFTDTNKIWLWEDQEFAPTDLYGLSALGNSGGTTNLTMGIKTGTGDDATGAQGLIISAASAGVRWDLDFDDPDLDAIGLFGCTFIHSGDAQVDDAAVEIIGTSWLDGTSMTLGQGLLQRCSIIDANTADGVAYIDASDIEMIKFCGFEFSDGHAIEVTSVAGSPFAFPGNLFTGYGADASTDAAILIDALTGVLNVSDGGDTPTKREISGGSLTINNNVSLTLTGLRDNTEVRVYTAGTTTELAGVESATDGSSDDRSVTFSIAASTSVDIRFAHGIAADGNVYRVPDRNSILAFTWPTVTTTIPITQVLDRNFDNPA